MPEPAHLIRRRIGGHGPIRGLDKPLQHEQIFPPLAVGDLTGKELEQLKLPFAQAQIRLGLVALQEGRVGIALVDNDVGVDGFVPVKVQQRWDAPQDLLELLVFAADEPDASKLPVVQSVEDLGFGHLVKAHRGAAGDHRAPLLHNAAQRVLVVGAVTRKRDGNQVVLLVVSDEVQHQRVFLALAFSQATAQLLDENDRRVRAAQHDDLVQGGNVHAFVEDVHREDVLEFALL